MSTLTLVGTPDPEDSFVPDSWFRQVRMENLTSVARATSAMRSRSTVVPATFAHLSSLFTARLTQLS